MNTHHACLFIILLITDVSVAEPNGTIEDLLRLREHLFSNYTTDVRPAYNLSDIVNMDATFFLLSILDFDEVAGVITLSAGLSMFWQDYRLKWTPSDYGGIEDIILNSTNIWKPKIFLMSSASDLEQFGSVDFDVRVYYTGDCSVSPGKLIKSSCSVDMKKYPMDSQTCEMLIVPWGLRPDEVKLTHSMNEFAMTYYKENGEWNVDKTDVYDYTGYGTSSSVMAFALHITRRSMYFIISMTTPVMLLCFLNPFVFLLPASSGERVSYIITMFLSLAVYMTLIGDNMPKVSENMAGMSYFLLIALLYSCVLIVLTIFTLRCDAVTDVSKFPKWLRKLTWCLYSAKRTRVGITSPCHDDVIEEVNNVEQDDRTMVTEDDSIPVQKDDVMKVIDSFLFVMSFVVIVVMTSWFCLTYYG